MERVEFLIERSHERIPCMFNPESLTLQRSSGAQRASSHLLNNEQSDDSVKTVGRGDTRFQLELLFDVQLTLANTQLEDVRWLTQPLWELTEYDPDQKNSNQLPTARFIWGRAWNLRVVVESLSERYIRFARNGHPETSLVTMSLLRIADDSDLGEKASPVNPLLADIKMAFLDDENLNWEAHVSQEGERIDELAARYYGHPTLWRVIATANEIDDPQTIPPGTRLRIPPLSALR